MFGGGGARGSDWPRGSQHVCGVERMPPTRGKRVLAMVAAGCHVDDRRKGERMGSMRFQ